MPKSKKNVTEPLFSEITQQLQDIEATTEESTNAIMELAERQLDNLTQTRRLLETAKNAKSQAALVRRMREGNLSLHNDLMSIITALSFHDLTVQRSRKIAAALDCLRDCVLPGAAAKAVPTVPLEPAFGSALKGPVRDASQSSVDDLLAQLGGPG